MERRIDDQGDEITVWEITPTHPNGFGGHVFNYESVSDLFKCENCGRYEISVRDDSGEIQPCVPS
jgi:hypothetical protein